MDSFATPADAFREAASRAGSQAALAELVGKRQPAISKRLKAGKPAEPEEVLTIERVLGIAKEILRPDLYPPKTLATRTATEFLEANR